MMRFKLFAFIAVLLASVLPATAQDTSTLNTISFNGYGFSYSDTLPLTNLKVNISRYAGDPSDAQESSSTRGAYTRFDLFTQEFTPDPLDDAWSDVTLRFYKTADVSYSFTRLQTLLKDRPVLTSVISNTGNTSLPFLVPAHGVQVLSARPRYIETASVTGISYITYLTLGVDPLHTESYIYTFQGLSNDGSTYVSMVALLHTLAVPASAEFDTFASEPDSAKFEAAYAAYLAEAARLLDEATPDQFEPNLDDLEAFVRTTTVK
jgi:hypothetical protein